LIVEKKVPTHSTATLAKGLDVANKATIEKARIAISSDIANAKFERSHAQTEIRDDITFEKSNKLYTPLPVINIPHCCTTTPVLKALLGYPSHVPASHMTWNPNGHDEYD
jgi:hypothetical protein